MWSIYRESRRLFPGLVNFVPAIAYLFCLYLPAAFSQPGDHNFAGPCMWLREVYYDLSVGDHCFKNNRKFG